MLGFIATNTSYLEAHLCVLHSIIVQGVISPVVVTFRKKRNHADLLAIKASPFYTTSLDLATKRYRKRELETNTSITKMNAFNATTSSLHRPASPSPYGNTHMSYQQCMEFANQAKVAREASIEIIDSNKFNDYTVRLSREMYSKNSIIEAIAFETMIEEAAEGPGRKRRITRMNSRSRIDKRSKQTHPFARGGILT